MSSGKHPTHLHTTTRPLLAGWRLTAEELATARSLVTIAPDRLQDILPWIAPAPPNAAWRTYANPVTLASPDLPKLFLELALTISQFGGFIAYAANGSIETWKRDGSGVKAIVHTMQHVREAHKLPGIDIFKNIDRELAHFFINTPFARQRLSMLEEIGKPQSMKFFCRLLETARLRDGSFAFNVLHMIGLACRFPLSFGEDTIFYKKASLLLLTMEMALNQLGEKAIALTLPPADYRIPQILEGLGILQFNDILAAHIQSGHVFSLDDKEVIAIRTMTIEAVGMIHSLYEDRHRKPISRAELDGALYGLSRDSHLMALSTMRPHMRVATAAF